ncbi:hypothetical protein ACW5QP_11725, partial [Microbacterium arborescens]
MVGLMADCSNPIDVALNPVECGAQAVGGLIGSQMEKFTQELYRGANDLWNGFFTSWIQSPPEAVIGGATSEWFAAVAGPIQAVLLAIGLMVAGIRTMLLARGEPAADAAKKLLRAILVTVVGTAFFQIMLLGSNSLARWILDTASGGTTPNLVGDVATFGGNIAMAMIFGVFGLIVVGIQWLIMILRAVALTVLVPFWPVAASGAMFERHEKMFTQTTGWLIAFLLYSPLAAALYGMSIRLRQGADGLAGVMIGMAIFLLALFALPALVKLVMPAAAALGSASAGSMMMRAGGAMMTAGVAAGAVVATGGAAAPVVAGGGAAAAGGGA